MPPLVLPLKLPSPAYTAVTVWRPIAMPVVEIVALPVGSRATAVPKLTPSTRNWTRPVARPAPGATAVTVAVRVAGDAWVAGVRLVVTTVGLAARLTVRVRLALVLGRSLTLPPYAAETVWVPTARVFTTSVARPVVPRVTRLPKGAPSIENWTVPVATGPLAGVTRAVNVTFWPKTDGFRLLVTSVVVA